MSPISVWLGWIAARDPGFDFQNQLVPFLYFRERDKVVRFLRGSRGEGLPVKQYRLNPAGSVQLQQQAFTCLIDRWLSELSGQTKTPGVARFPADGKRDPVRGLRQIERSDTPSHLEGGFDGRSRRISRALVVSRFTGKVAEHVSCAKLQDSRRLWYTLIRSDSL